MIERARASETSMDRRQFTFALGGAAGLTALLPFSLPAHGIHLHGPNEGMRIIEETKHALPGGGNRSAVTMALEMPGRFVGETTMIQDVWPTEDGNGSVAEFYWTASPPMDTRFGETLREFRTRMTTEYGPAVDRDYREVTIRVESSAPGIPAFDETYRGKQRFVLIEPDPSEVDAAMAAVGQGVPFAEALRDNVTSLQNTIDLEAVRPE